MNTEKYFLMELYVSLVCKELIFTQSFYRKYDILESSFLQPSFTT